jgi:hypothetical protein
LDSNQARSLRAALSPTTATAGPVAASGLTPAALRSAAAVPSAPVTVCWSVVVPFQVMANGVVSGQPAAISIFARSTGAVSAPGTTSVPGACGSRDTLLTSEACTIRTLPARSEMSAIPA